MSRYEPIAEKPVLLVRRRGEKRIAPQRCRVILLEIGRHQVENAGTAIATLRAAGLALPLPAFEAGIAKADWPARMQRLTQGALKALTPPESELWLDGGHNADAGRAIASALAGLEERVPKPLVPSMIAPKLKAISRH